MKRYSKHDIREYIASGLAVDITDYSFAEVQQLRQRENGLEIIGTCYNQIGITGGICKGYKTGNLYAVQKRNATLLQIF